MNVYLSVDFKLPSPVIRSPQIILQKIQPTLTFTLRYGPACQFSLQDCGVSAGLLLSVELTIAKRKWKRHIYLGHDHRKKFPGAFGDKNPIYKSLV